MLKLDYKKKYELKNYSLTLKIIRLKSGHAVPVKFYERK